MSHSLSDTVKSVESSIPGAKVLNAKHFSNPAGVQAAERGTRAWKDRCKRTADEEFGGQKYKAGSVRSRCVNEYADDASGWKVVDVLTKSGKRLVPRVYGWELHKSHEWIATASKEAMWHGSTVRWVDPDNVPESIELVPCGHPAWSKQRWVLLECTPEEHGHESPEYPTETVFPKLTKKQEKYRLSHKGMTIRGLGGMERTNENLGGIFGGHGAPEVAEAMRAAGVLQTRRDENGNPVETAVFSSRRDMEQKIKMFNRMQREAQDRGFQGTRGGVKYARHGGVTPD